MTQASLFDRPPTFVDSDRPGYSHRDAGATEVNAALAVREGRGAKRLTILEALVAADWNGLTDFEVERVTGFIAQTITSCRNSLVDDGYVKKTDRTRDGRAGLPVSVWVATQSGRNALRRAS